MRLSLTTTRLWISDHLSWKQTKLVPLWPKCACACMNELNDIRKFFLFTQLATTRSVLLIFIQRWCEERNGSVDNGSWPQTTIKFMFTSSVSDKSWKVTPKHSPLVAGCSIVNKHCTLHLNKLDISQTKNQIALQIIFFQRCFMSF